MGEIVPVAKQAADMRKFFEERKGAIGMALAKAGVTPQRIIQALFTAAEKTPSLYQCEIRSVYKAMLLAAQSGLIPDGITQHAHLIPRKNNKKGGILECNLQIGYRGLLVLCRRSGEVTAIAVHAVYANEKFKLALGTSPVIEHEPFIFGADGPGELRGCYATADFVKGGRDFEWMSVGEIEALRRRSGTDDDSKNPAWGTDYAEMAKKTVLRRLCKRLPQSEDSQRLLELDDTVEVGLPQNLGEASVPGIEEAKAADVSSVTTTPGKEPTAEEIAAELKKRPLPEPQEF